MVGLGHDQEQVQREIGLDASNVGSTITLQGNVQLGRKRGI